MTSYTRKRRETHKLGGRPAPSRLVPRCAQMVLTAAAAAAAAWWATPDAIVRGTAMWGGGSVAEHGRTLRPWDA